MAQAPRPSPSVLIVYFSGEREARPVPPLDCGPVDGLTHATTSDVNAALVAQALQRELVNRGCRVAVKTVHEISDPREILDYDGLIIGTPVWFSNMATPVKKFFDAILIRIYDRRPERLNDKTVSAFCTVVENGPSGPRCLQALMWGLEHLSGRRVTGAVIQTTSAAATWQRQVAELADRFVAALRDDLSE